MPDLTDKQRQQLEALFDGAAVSRESAKGALDLPFGSSMVLGKLRDLGFARSRIHRPPGGSQRTLYWLTETGVSEAVALKAGRARAVGQMAREAGLG
jgi:hypothetical protein